MSLFRSTTTTTTTTDSNKNPSPTRVRRSLSLFGIAVVGIAFTLLLSISDDIRSVRFLETTTPIEYQQRSQVSSEYGGAPLYSNQGSNNALVTTINNLRSSIASNIHRKNLLDITNKNNTKLYNKWYGAGLNEAYDESFGYFDDITNDQWDLKRERSRAFPVWYNPENPNIRLAYTEYALFHIENVYPSFTCKHLMRVGDLDGEGPKWVCDPHRLAKYNDCLIYSIGSDGDYKFEDALIELLGNTNCEFHVFDPHSQFARPDDVKTKNIHFHDWGIGSDPNVLSTVLQFKTFTETLKVLGHTHRRIDLLKIDCEGCEWYGYQDWLFSSADIRQISIETHSEKAKYVQIVPFFNDLFDQGYVLYSKEANTMPGMEPYGSFFEWSFIKLSKSFGKYGDGTPERLQLLTQRAAKNNNFNKNYQNAYDDSYGYFDDITNTDWQMKQQHAQDSPLFRKLSNPDYQRQHNPALWHMNNVYPTFTCPNILRVAGLADGPKWICDPERLNQYDDCLIYSFGSNGNYMFEDAMINLLGSTHCEIHVFDPNPDYARPNDATTKNIHYHAWGMGSSYSTTNEFGGYTFKSFPDILNELGHVGRRIDIFKIDCEGCEWNSYKDWLTDSVDIRQIAIETHAVSAGSVSVGQFFLDIFSKGFVMYSKEANTWPNDRYLQGTFFEWSFIKLKPTFSGADKFVSTKSNEATAITNQFDTTLYNRSYGVSFNEAYNESFGYFDDIPNSKWDLKRERSRAFPVWLDPGYPGTHLASHNFALFHIDNVYPSFTCTHLVRVGDLGEGPKWICDPHRLSKYEDCLIYSVGSDGDYIFEDSLIRLLNHTKCEIHVFDPDPKLARKNDVKTNNIHYHAWGIGYDPNGNSASYKTFTDTLTTLQHNGRRIDLLRIDCEGCEWAGYEDWLYGSADIRQISVETHSAQAGSVSVVAFFNDLLNEGYVVYSKEANTWPGLHPYGSFFEWSFIKLSKSFGKFGQGNAERLKLLNKAAAKNENYNDDYKEAFDDSLGFFDDILNADWKMKREHAQNSPLFNKLADPDYQRLDNPAIWHINNVYPTFACPNLLRVAGLADGPKWICDPERLNKYDDCLIYSFGSNGNYMFEDATIDLLGNTHCEIHVFDPNPDFARPDDAATKNIHYHAWGMGSSYSATAEFGGYTFKSFPDILKELGHVGRRIDIFKIDCEGCEWNSYKDWLTDSVDIRQIAIETHAISAGSVNVGQFFLDIFSKGFVMYSKEANTWPNEPKLQGSFFEWSFIKLKPSFSGADKIVTNVANEAKAITNRFDTTLYNSSYGALFNEAYNESFGYFDDLPNSKWDLKRERSRSFPVWLDPAYPGTHLESNDFALFHIDNIYPSFTCSHLVRVGDLGEGPKWICDPHRLTKYNDCLIYSVGSDGDYVFEDALIKLLNHTQCEIHVFDPDPKYARENDIKNNNIHYHAWGIGYDRGREMSSYQFKSFTDTLAELKHTNRRIDLLRIDCEGCEWAGYRDWLFGSADIRQVSVETHSGKSRGVSIVSFFRELFDQGYVVYSKEANTWPGLHPYGSFFEWSFIKLGKSFGKYGDGNPKRLKLLNKAAAKNEHFNDDYKEAFEDSYGFFDDIVNNDWKMKRAHAQNSPLFTKLGDPDYQRLDNPALWHINNAYPTFACPNLLRVAGLGDGPKWICDPERLNKYDDCLIYSFGSNGNYMFEDAMIDLLGNTRCEIHVFDPNPDFARPDDAATKNIHYHAWGMGSSYSATAEFGGYTFRSFPDILKELGHEGRRTDIFKIDCEGCEWNSYKDWLTDSVDIRQIAIETHAMAAGSVSVGQFFLDIFSKGFVMYSKEANTWPNPPDVQGSFFEWSFLKLKPSFSVVGKISKPE